MSNGIIALEAQHDSTGIETDATDTFAETDVPIFGGDDPEEAEASSVPPWFSLFC